MDEQEFELPPELMAKVNSVLGSMSDPEDEKSPREKAKEKATEWQNQRDSLGMAMSFIHMCNQHSTPTNIYAGEYTEAIKIDEIPLPGVQRAAFDSACRYITEFFDGKCKRRFHPEFYDGPIQKNTEEWPPDVPKEGD